MPEALAAQLPAVSDYLARAAIREQRIEAFEADDVIASAAAWARPEADEIVVASDDKDLCQLVDERVSLLSLSKKERMGPAEVAGRMGVGPGRVVELLALTGDAVDNIPGVPGVGPKTAVRLLAEHPSLDDLFARLDGVEPERVRTALREHRADVLRNAELTRLRSDLDCGVTWDALAIRPEDPARLLPFYESLEFRAMADALRSPELDLGPA